MARHVRGAASAGVFAHLFSALSGLSGSGPSPHRRPAPWPEIMSTNLPGRSGVALLLCRLAMCSSLQGVPQEKPFPVFASRWAAPARCTGPGPSLVHSEQARERGITACCPPFPFHLQRYVTTTQPHARSYCWCHSFSAKIALKNSLGPSSNRSTAGMC